MTNTPAGWYPDPQDATRSRWWDGTQWTEHQSAPYVAAASPAQLKAPEGTPWNTVWIWILVFLPYVSSLGLFAIDWSSAFDLTNPLAGQLGLLASPGYLFMTLGGIVTFGLFVWFSYLDWRILVQRGVPKPFHWAWGFLSIVYTIGRSVVVRRRTGHGISPMWVTIVTYAVYTIGLIVYLAVIMTTLFTSIAELSRAGY